MHWLKALLPRNLKRSLRQAHRQRILDQSLQALLALPEGTQPDPELLRRLQYGWGNRGYAADREYLGLIAATITEVDGPIFECGSGLSTILMGALCRNRGIEIISLEHHEGWHRHVADHVERLGLTTVRVHHAPLIGYDGFDWYAIPDALPQRPFAVAVCDGPPEKTTRGARLGLLPLMRDRLAPGCVILMDDADRPAQVDVIDSWRGLLPGIEVETRSTGLGASAVLTLPVADELPRSATAQG